VTTSEADFCCHSSDFMEGGEPPDMEGAPPRRWVNIDSGCNAFTIELGLGARWCGRCFSHEWTVAWD
jgi:hypothetical protein